MRLVKSGRILNSLTVLDKKSSLPGGIFIKVSYDFASGNVVFEVYIQAVLSIYTYYRVE